MADEQIEFEGKTYDLSKAEPDQKQIIRGLARVIHKAQQDLLDANDQALIDKTALHEFFKRMREDHLREDMLVVTQATTDQLKQQ